ncbi:hypothetical protein IU479_28930 [Nocardia abscessus]|uniref:hypothetical protein n=1 Tax=Nocardia TaxID=1817 RepID=UPI001894ED53|nr:MULTISPECIES: hypothetical protein [Nocardia]MBF6222120.1 hypothetical protein [Nocardia abscessus]MDE1672500.1 hypothetical protein [Nocardia gipuzkoensis]
MSRPARTVLAGNLPRNAIARTRHIRVETGAFAMDYQAGAAQIADVVAELGAHGGFVVTVDDNVRPDLPHLPCGKLWD